MDDGEGDLGLVFLILVPAALLGLILLVGFALVAVAIVAWPTSVLAHAVLKLLARPVIVMVDWVVVVACVLLGIALFWPFAEPRTWVALLFLELAAFFIGYTQRDQPQLSAS